jgi:hypothetical protein
MIEKTYKIPEGSETIVDNMVAVGVERFIRQQMEIPVEEKIEYREAIDTFRADNHMELRFAKVEEVQEEPKVEEVQEEPKVEVKNVVSEI